MRRHPALLVAAAAAACLLAGPHAFAAPEAKAGKRFDYDAGGHRDPFIPLVRDGRIVSLAGLSSAGSSSVPVLHGILWEAGGRSIALINSSEAKVGDTVDGYQVVEIRHDAVVLSSGGDPVVLQINFEKTGGSVQ